MKSVFGLILILLFGCASSSQLSRIPAENIIDLSQNQDEEEYKLIVLDPGFDTWFATTWNSGNDRSVDYYSHWNYRYVSEWNYKVTRPNTSQFFDTMIQYDPNIDYGIEIERKLYYYFKWVDTKLGIQILDIRPRG